MASFKPAMVSKGSFAFCRATIATLIVLSIVFQNIWLLTAEALIMLLSAIFKIEKAPLILLWKYTFGKIFKSKMEILDERGIYVSHITAVIFSCICIVLILLFPLAGWFVTGLFAILQISAACGFCSALKLYTCMNNGTCCKFGKKIKKLSEKSNSDTNCAHFETKD